jgi:hypothetical protein
MTVGQNAAAKKKPKKAQPAAQKAMSDEAVAAAVGRLGFADARVLARGPVERGPLALLEAARDGMTAVVATVADSAAPQPRLLVLDTVDGAKTRVKAQATAFLGATDLFDLVVESSPLVTEGHETTSRHYIVRRSGPTLAVACRFAGSASKSGKGSYGGASVNLEKVSSAGQPTFDITVDETSSEHPGEHKVSVTRMQLQAKGECKQLPGR